MVGVGWRRRFVVGVLSAALVSACDWGLTHRGGLVANFTSQDVVVEVVGATERHRGELGPQQSAQWDAPDGGGLGSGVALYTPRGKLLTTLDERICDGRELRIESADLPFWRIYDP